MTQPFPLLADQRSGAPGGRLRDMRGVGEAKGGNKSLHTSSSVRTRHCEYCCCCYYYYYYYYYY